MGTEINTLSNEVDWQNFALNTGKAIGAGAVGMGTVIGVAKVIDKPIKKAMVGSLENVNSLNSIFKEAALKALQSEKINYSDISNPINMFVEFMAIGLKQKPSKFEQHIREFKEKITPKFIKEKNIKKMDNGLESFVKGQNACYLGVSGVKKIFVNFDKASATVFHEMGHAKNDTCKGIGKILTYMRHPMVKKIGIGTALVSAALFAPSKSSENNENKSIITKGKEFLKDNCVTIAALSCLPEIMEEGLASIKGAKIASKDLPKSACNIINKLNVKALGTYTLGAFLLTSGVYLTNKFRNAIE